MEIETDKQHPFLTYTGLLLDFTSFTSRVYETGLIKCLVENPTYV